MSERTNGKVTTEERIGEVLGGYLNALEAGEAPELSVLLAEHPELAGELAAFFDQQERFARLVAPLRAAAEVVRENEPTVADPQAPLPSVTSRQARHAEQAGSDPGATLDVPPPTDGGAADGGGGDGEAGGGDADEALPRGTRVRYFGDYVLLKELGRGGMGVVYMARQITLNRPVALKMLKSDMLATDDELRRFQNEAEAVALLDHPHIVPIIEVGEHEGRRYFTMKLINGQSLDRKLNEYTANAKAAARLLATAAEAVHHAHQRGILHRDLKPANILLDDRGQPYVTDFGLAKRVAGESELTQSGAILGTPGYMSPEQTWGRRGTLTMASDVYGLGAVLYALLGGRAPFAGDTVVDTIQQVRERAPNPLSKVNPRTPRDLDVICLKCLEKDPLRRYSSAQALADDLRRYLAGEPITARRTGTRERVWLWSKRNPWLAGAVGSTAAAVMAVAVVSTVFAIEQTRAKNRITVLAGDLQSSLAKSETLSGTLTLSLKESNRRLARLDFERAQNAFEKEQIGPGLCWLVQSWRSAAAADDPVWRHAARAALSAWSRHHMETRMILSHAESIVKIAYSPDGKSIVTASHDHTARVWDAATGRPLTAPLQHQDRVNSVAFSPDGKTLLTGSDDRTARLWDAATGQPIGVPMRHHKEVGAVTFSPDGKRVLTVPSRHGILTSNIPRLWDAATGRPVAPELRHDNVWCVAFSPDGKTILTGGGDRTARLWDANTGQSIGTTMQHPEQSVNAVAFSPDGKTVLTGGTDKTARLWDAATGQPIGAPMRHQDFVVAVAFSPDGKTIIAGGSRGHARLWDARTGQPVGDPMRHHGYISTVAFSPDGRTALTGSWDGTARLWDTATGLPVGTPMRHQNSVEDVAFSPDGRSVLTGSSDGTARLWGAKVGRPSGLPLLHHSAVEVLAFSPDGKKVLSGGGIYGHSTQLWDADTGQPLGNPLPQPDRVQDVAFSPDGKTMLTAGDDFTARLWDAATGRPLATPLRHQNTVSGVRFSPDGRTVLTGSWDGTARLWDAATGRPLGPPLRHQTIVTATAFSPDAKSVVTGSQDGAVRLWDAAAARPIGPSMQHRDVVTAVAFSPEGKTLLSASFDATARLWDPATGQPIGAPLRHQKRVSAIAFSPDGKFVLTGSDDATSRLWDAATGQPVGTAMQHGAGVTAVAFSPDGKTLLSASTDATARLWDAATAGPLGPVLQHEGYVWGVVFSPDGKTVLTGSTDKTARLWDVRELPDELERVAAWIEVATGLRFDDSAEIRLLDNTAWNESRERLARLGGAPTSGPRWSLDPILFGTDPSARARSWIQRGRPDEALAAFDEAVRERPLSAPLWAERARFHSAQGRVDRAIDDAAQAALACWNDPKLAALVRNDATFREEALDEILKSKSQSPFDWRPGSDVWRDWSRAPAFQRDWAGAVRKYAESARPVPSMGLYDLLAYVCLLRLTGDDERASRLAAELRSLPEPLPAFYKPDGPPASNHSIRAAMLVRLLEDPPPDPADLIQRAEAYPGFFKGERAYVVGAALLRAGRLEEAVRRFEESLAIEPEWHEHGLNAYGLASAHHRLGHREEARRWLDRAERWLNDLDRMYATAAPSAAARGQVPFPFESWVYAQVLRRQATRLIRSASFPVDPLAR
jgi:WD40 repeat protein/serine/threonine protein kinase/tetratricopeptide (TPR) repeat protein